MNAYFRTITFSLIMISSLVLNAQKTIQNYVNPGVFAAVDSVVTYGESVQNNHPFVIIPADDNSTVEDPPGPVEMSFGEIPYSIETTQTGQVHLNIPINAYASEYEFAPQLSLDYNSGRGSFDFLGRGWKLKGLPVVSRVPKDFFTDGEVEGISLTDNHLFALDGERLIYQDESDGIINFSGQTSNVKVQFINNQWFKVLYPDGNIATMNCTDSINYYVTNLRQKDGQEIRYYYTSTGDEQKHISSIYYGDNKKMVFDYFTTDNRVEPVDYYCAGKLFKKRYKLKDIAVMNSANENDTTIITRYLLWNSGKVESPFDEIDQYFAGGKYYFPMKLTYMYQNTADETYTQSDTLTNMFYDTNPAECVIQRGKFSHFSEGDGFLMFKNRDTYYFDKSANVYKNGYDESGQIIVAHNSNMDGGRVPCSNMNMGYGFVDAFTANTDGIHGEEILRVRNWKPSINYNHEELYIDIFSADNNTLTYKKTLDARDVEQSSVAPFMPKTFLTGDFTGDGKVELLVIKHDDTDYGINTSYRLLSLYNGEQLIKDNFNKHYSVFFPKKNYADEQIGPYLRWSNYKRSAKFFTIDYNGDGKMEVGVVDSLGMRIYEFHKNTSGNLSLRIACEKTFPSLHDLKDYAFRIGEFNGDGIADMVFYLESNNQVLDFTTTLYKSFLGKGDGTFVLRDSIYADDDSVIPENIILQTNGDPISDLMARGKRITTQQSGLSLEPCLIIIRMRDGMFVSSQTYTSSDSVAVVPSHFYGECNDAGFLTVDNRGEIKKYDRTKRLDTSWKLERLLDSYHNYYDFTYRRIFESDDYHPDFNRYQFPYTTFAKGQIVCHTMKKFDTSHNIVEEKQFSYGNAVAHEQGLGFIGFDNVTVTDSITGKLQNNDYDVLKMGAIVRAESHQAINRYTLSLNVTQDRRIQLRQTGLSHYDKATCITDTTSFSHDLYGNVTKAVTLFAGGQSKTVISQYDNHTDGGRNIIGQPSTVTTILSNANGSVTTGVSYTYNSYYLPTSEKKFFGNENQVTNEVQLTYDSQNRIVSEKKRTYNSPWLTTSFYYTGDNRKPSSITDSRGWNQKLIYGKFGVTKNYELNASSVIVPSDPIGGHAAGINSGIQGFDPQMDPYGPLTAYDYDEAGNVTCTTNPDGTKHFTDRTWVYNSLGFGAKFFVTDSVTGQPVTRTYINSLGQKTRVETQRPDGSFLKVDYEYDARGRLVKQYEPYKTSNSLFTSYEYDNFDRLISKTYPDGHSDTFTYNGLTISSNAGGITSSKTLDELGNLVSVTDPGGTISYNMTADGRPVSINVNGEASTSFEYDSYGRKTALNDPSAGRTSYTYDTSGNIATVTDARGNVTAAVYNSHGKPTSVTIGGDMVVTYTYNNYLQPTAVTCSNGNSKQYTYNKYHKLTSETINGFKKSYNYSGGNIISISYSFSNASLGTEQYVRTRGTVTAINYGGKTLWQLGSEDNHAMPTAVSGSVVSTNLEYDDMGRVTDRIAETNLCGTFHDMHYEYDTYGNLTSREDRHWSNSEDFGYDNLGRLVTTPAGDITYDGKGNITEHDAAGVFGYASSRPYALSQIALSASDLPTATQAITFNAMNRPDSISEGAASARLKYFEDGERSQMLVSTGNGSIVHNYCGNQFTASSYTTPTYEGQRQILFLGGDAYTAPAAIVREKESGANAWSQALYYIVRDNLGSIVHVVDSTGLVAQELSYDAWGRLRDPGTQQPYAPGEQPELLLGRGYCGHEHLAHFNLINMNARLYDPWTARFLSPDPYVQLPDLTQSLNRYSYCLNNPLKFVDPSGKDSWYTNDKKQIKAFLQFYIQQHGHFAGNTLDDWLNEHGWEYEGEGLNRIDLDKMRIYSTYTTFGGSNFTHVDESHINMNEITVNLYYYDLSYVPVDFNGLSAHSLAIEESLNKLDNINQLCSPISACATLAEASYQYSGNAKMFLNNVGKVFALPGTISALKHTVINISEGNLFTKEGIVTAGNAIFGMVSLFGKFNPYIMVASVAWYLVGEMITR